MLKRLPLPQETLYSVVFCPETISAVKKQATEAYEVKWFCVIHVMKQMSAFGNIASNQMCFGYRPTITLMLLQGKEPLH